MGIITLIVTIPLVVIMLYRIVYDGGITIGRENVFNRSSYKKDNEEKLKLTDILKVGFAALSFRLFIYVISYLLMILVYNNEGTFLEWWTKWDAEAYIGITSGGYSNNTIDGIAGLGNGVLHTLVFFPLYPWLASFINLFVGNVQIALMTTSTICFVAACIVMYMAVHHRYGKDVASKAVILTAICPFAFYQGGMLPESTFLLTCALCVLFTYKKKWWLAGIMGILCALARLQGVVIIAFIGLEWMHEKQILALIKNKEWKTFLKALINIPAVLMPSLGVVIYLFINRIYTGDAFYFMKLQKAVWNHSYAHINVAMDNIYNNLLKEETHAIRFSVWIPELIIFFGVIALLYVVIGRHSIGMSVYLFLYTIISFSSDYVISATRYMSVSVVLFIFLACICEKRPAVYKSLVTASLMLQVIYMACHLSGWHLVT